MDPASHPHHSPADRTATVVAAVLAVLTVAASVLISPFFVMTSDACGSDNCDLSRLNWAFAVTWGGVALAVLIGLIGVVRAIRRGTTMWIWPVLTIAVVVVTFGAGFLLATSVLQQH